MGINTRPLLILAAIAAATSPDMGRGALEKLKTGAREGFAKDPMGTVLATVLGGSWLFYKAERGHNPKVKSFYDALVYVSTNLSVGYCDIFAKTERGKAIGSVLMTYGPAMAAKIFDAPTKAATTAPAAPDTNGDASRAASRDAVKVSAAAAPAAPGAASPAPASSPEVLEKLERILAMLEANRAKRRALARATSSRA